MIAFNRIAVTILAAMAFAVTQTASAQVHTRELAEHFGSSFEEAYWATCPSNLFTPSMGAYCYLVTDPWHAVAVRHRHDDLLQSDYSITRLSAWQVAPYQGEHWVAVDFRFPAHNADSRVYRLLLKVVEYERGRLGTIVALLPVVGR